MKLYNFIFSFLPTPLPVGVTEFNTWSESIIKLAGPYADSDSMKQALANMVMHLGPKKGSDTARGYVPKRHFVLGLRKGAANQIASHIFQEIRLKQQKALDESKQLEQQKAEETALKEAVNVQAEGL